MNGISIRKRQSISILFSVTVLAISIWIGILSITIKLTDEQCVQAWSAWSPALAAINYNWEIYTHIKFGERSIYDGMPNPRREEAWDQLIPGTRFKLEI
jgi:hypothetical protein